MCINMLSILSVEGPASCCHCCCSFVGQKEYQGAEGCSGAVSTPGKGAKEPCGAQGGARGELWDVNASCPDADRPGLGGLVGGWARLTRSSPNESDSLSDSGIWQSLNGAGVECVNFVSFTGNRVSSNFTSQEISKHQWAVSQNWYPLDPGSYPMKIISQLFGLGLCLLFFRMCTQARQPKT